MDVGDGRIEYAVVKGASRRYTYFRFRPDLTLEVILPSGKPRDAEAAIKEKLRWILKERDRLAITRRILGPDSVMFGGVSLRMVSGEACEGFTPDLAKGEVRVPGGDQPRVREFVRRWFLKETSAYVVRRVRELSPRLGVRPSRVDVREISKWGYCTRNGRLSFSWQLIALPERLREYVVLHELAHLAEFNHSRSFKAKLKSVCPDFKEREKELELFVPYDRLAPT